MYQTDTFSTCFPFQQEPGLTQAEDIAPQLSHCPISFPPCMAQLLHLHLPSSLCTTQHDSFTLETRLGKHTLWCVHKVHWCSKHRGMSSGMYIRTTNRYLHSVSSRHMFCFGEGKANTNLLKQADHKRQAKTKNPSEYMRRKTSPAYCKHAHTPMQACTESCLRKLRPIFM